MAELCGWCVEAPWAFQCSTCDPRSTKKLCLACTNRWHSRGFSREHVLQSRTLDSRPFHDWAELIKTAVDGASSSSDTASARAVDERSSAGEAGVSSSSAPLQAAATPSNSVPIRPSSDQYAMEQAATSNAPDQVISTEITNSNFSSSSTGPPRVEVVEENAPVEFAAPGSPGNEHLPAEDPEGCDVSNSNEDAAMDAESVVLGTSEASTASSSTETEQQQQGNSYKPGAPTTVSTSAWTSSNSSHELDPDMDMDLERLLRLFPTEDPALQEMLAMRINAALVVEDALMCARYHNCTEPSCWAAKIHQDHCKSNQPCTDPACIAGFKVFCHRRTCPSATANSDGSNGPVCPFCLRVRQRRVLGAKVSLDQSMNQQRRAYHELGLVKSANCEARRNFYLQTISMCQKRRAQYLSEIEELNRLASDNRVPVFNFPPYNWHFTDKTGVVAIKGEPTIAETATEPSGSVSGSTDPVNVPPGHDRGDLDMEEGTRDVSASTKPPASSLEEVKMNQSPHLPDYTPVSSSEKTLENTAAGGGDDSDSMPANPNFCTGFIDDLLRRRRAGNGENIAREFDQTMDLGYSIVDASFCAPAKAQRCLLNCQTILVHLQHHLDLKVCKQDMCMAVEHHFSHLSKCKARKQETSCEYCLRVQEREFARAVDLMEADQPEADARVQTIINAITTSFTDDPPEEREQAVLQLEDELDQAEDNKRDLAEKLSTSRMKLRHVRKSMERLGFPTASNRPLPLHFIKVRPEETAGGGHHGNGSKKRRLLGSFD